MEGVEIVERLLCASSLDRVSGAESGADTGGVFVSVFLMARPDSGLANASCVIPDQ